MTACNHTAIALSATLTLLAGGYDLAQAQQTESATNDQIQEPRDYSEETLERKRAKEEMKAEGLATAPEQATQGAADKGGDAADQGQLRPLTLTCQELVDQDIALIPAMAHWIDGYSVAYTQKGQVSDVDPVVAVSRQWFAVPVDKIITVCKANPQMAASEAIRQQREENTSSQSTGDSGDSQNKGDSGDSQNKSDSGASF